MFTTRSAIRFVAKRGPARYHPACSAEMTRCFLRYERNDKNRAAFSLDRTSV